MGYFESLNETLRTARLGRPGVVLDLDRVDHNLEQIRGSVGERLRVVDKSLPSVALLQHVMRQTGSRRLMAFHLPFLPQLLETLPDVDVLLGKPFLPAAAREFLAAAPAAQRGRVQWLIDSPDRLHSYGNLAREFGPLRVSVEIDIGLHRGGVATDAECVALLESIAASEGRFVFSGFMGYDAHVPYFPDPDAAFERAMAKYAAFVNAGREALPRLFRGDLTFNSGGSNTVHRFAGDTPVNDVAAGSAVVKPARFDRLATHEPALFIAAPVLRRSATVSRSPVPPERATSLHLYGGGWAAEVSWPPDVHISEHADPANENLLPNQSQFFAGAGTPVDVGDFAFFQPRQGDAMFQFEEIHVVRGAEIVDVWQPFARRF